MAASTTPVLNGAASGGSPLSAAEARRIYIRALARQIIASSALIALALWLLLLLAYSWPEVAVPLIWSCAAAAVGAGLGFLFAVPRPKAAAPDGSELATTAPSPIEQVSDWLTKIIVGLGLAEFDAIQAALWRTAVSAGAGMGGRPIDRTVVLAVLIVYGVLGFLTAYLAQRLVLNPALATSETETKHEYASTLQNAVRSEVQSLTADIEPSVSADGTSGTTTGAGAQPDASAKSTLEAVAKMRPVVARLGRQTLPEGAVRDVLTRLAGEYERVRASMRAGIERTKRMDGLVREMTAYAAAGAPYLRELMNSASAGERVVALAFLETQPAMTHVEWLVGRFDGNETPFVEYHAAVALLATAQGCSDNDPDRAQLLAAVQRAQAAVQGRRPDAARDAALAQAATHLQGS